MMIREPAVAGSFYPADASRCRKTLDACFDARISAPAVRGRIVAGVVPHAGWVCSGRVTAAVFSAVAEQRRPATVVIFGAVHRPKGPHAALFPSGRWDMPTGCMAIDERLAQRIVGHSNLIVEDPYAHELEHSIEVQAPFIQRLFPDAKLLPIMVPPSRQAIEVGETVARTLQAYHYDAVLIASSDLTHYGPDYGFTPEGHSIDGLEWARNVNDRRIIDRMLARDAGAIVHEAREHRNACGAGAIAAVVAASNSLGADNAVLLDHTTSRETIGTAAGLNAVGYAGIVFTKT